MGVTVNIEVTKDNASPALRNLLTATSKSGMEEANTYGRGEMLNFIRQYHREMEARDGWENKSLPTHGAGRRPSGFGTSIVEAWQNGIATGENYSVVNGSGGQDQPSLAFKITGGTITAKSASALTIPMMPEAHGVRARNYPGDLFRPKGKDYLMENKDGVARIVYLLRKSVTMKPWPKAMPTDEAIEDKALHSLNEYIESILSE